MSETLLYVQTKALSPRNAERIQKKRCSYFLYVEGVFETNLSTQSRGHHRVNIVDTLQTCFSVSVVYASQFGIELNDSSFHSEYYIRTAMSLFQTTLKWP